MSHGRSEPVRLHRLRKQFTEALKEGPLEIMRKKGRENTPGGRRREKYRCAPERERESSHWEKKGLGKGKGVLERKRVLGPLS